MTDESEEMVIEDAPDITSAAMLDERRSAAREREAARLALLDEISPECENTYVDMDDPLVRLQLESILAGSTIGIDENDVPAALKTRCGHKLNRHDPCAGCAGRCFAFLGMNGETASEANATLRIAHQELFPEERQ